MFIPKNKRGQIAGAVAGGEVAAAGGAAAGGGSGYVGAAISGAARGAGRGAVSLARGVGGDISNSALIFCFFAIIVTGIQWYWFAGISTSVHAVVQFILLLAAAWIMGNHNPEMCERIAGVYSLQLSFIMFLSSVNGGFSVYSAITDHWTWMLAPILFALAVLTVFSGAGFAFAKDAVRKMLTPILGFAIGAALVGQFWVSGTDLFASLAPIIQGIHNILMFILSSMWVWWSLSYATKESKIARWLMFLAIAFFLVIAINSLYIAGVFSGGDDDVGVDYKSLSSNLWTTFVEGRTRGIEALREGITNVRNVTQRTLNPTFETKVEAQQGADVGVRFERQTGLKTSYRDNEDIFVRSVLKATTLDDPITMKFECNFEDVSAKENYTGRVSRETVFIRSAIEQPFSCELDPKKGPVDQVWPAGAKKVNLLATFDYGTSSYTKRYAMDIQRAEALQLQGVDPLEQYSITDKKPASIFTPGPVKLAVGSTDYTILTHADSKNETDLNIEITKNFGWDGEIHGLRELVVFLPDGITMKPDTTEDGNPLRCAGNFRFKAVSEVDLCSNPQFFEEDGCANFNIYTLDLEHFEDEHDKFSIQRPFVTNCPLEVSSSRTMLGNAPLGILSFRAYLDYNFVMKDAIPISIRKTESGSTSSEAAIKEFGILGSATDTLAIDGAIVESTMQSLRAGELQEFQKIVRGDGISQDIEESYYAILYGIMKANGYSPTSTGRCVGSGGRCGIMQISSAQYNVVKDLYNAEGTSTPLPDYETYSTSMVNDNELNAALVFIYLAYIKDTQCEGTGPGIPECLVGKYYAGNSFTYPDYRSCGTVSNACYYAIDTFVPQVLSYGSGYERVVGQ